jgi:hypothetical protein
MHPNSHPGCDAFTAWAAACTQLRLAEQRGDDSDRTLDLSEIVLRTRNILTRERMAAGWAPSDAVLRDLERDEHLFHESDARDLRSA